MRQVHRRRRPVQPRAGLQPLDGHWNRRLVPDDRRRSREVDDSRRPLGRSSSEELRRLPELHGVRPGRCSTRRSRGRRRPSSPPAGARADTWSAAGDSLWYTSEKRSLQSVGSPVMSSSTSRGVVNAAAQRSRRHRPDGQLDVVSIGSKIPGINSSITFPPRSISLTLVRPSKSPSFRVVMPAYDTSSVSMSVSCSARRPARAVRGSCSRHDGVGDLVTCARTRPAPPASGVAGAGAVPHPRRHDDRRRSGGSA